MATSSGISGLGNLSISGLGSSIDWQSIITQLNSAETAAKITPLNKQISTLQSRLSAWQTFGTDLSTLQTALTNLTATTGGQGLNVFSAGLTSNNPSVAANSILTATAGAGAGQGTYDLQVSQLAKAQKLSSSQQAQSLSATGSWTSTAIDAGMNGSLSINGTQVIGERHGMTLAAMQTSINASQGTTGVTAYIDTDASGHNFMRLTNNLTTQAAMTVQEKDNGTGNGVTHNFTTDGSTANSSLSTDAGLSGTLSIQGLSSTSHSIVNPTDGTNSLTGMSLQQIRDQINGWDTGSSPTGFKASILQVSSSDYRLTLTKDATGAGGRLAADPTSGAGGNNYFGGFTSTPAATTANVLQVGQDANFSIDNVSMTRSSNTFTDAIPGLTLNLVSDQSPATKVTVNVGQDTGTISKNVQSFVDAYNGVMGFINTQSSYDAANKKTGGPLFGDPSLMSIKNTLQTTLLKAQSTALPPPNGNGLYMSGVGITLGTNGNTLSFDSSKLATALSTNSANVASLFSNMGASVSTLLTNYTDPSTGTVTTEENTNQHQIDRLNTQITSSQSLIDAMMASYAKQYSAMDTAIGLLKSQSSVLNSLTTSTTTTG